MDGRVAEVAPWPAAVAGPAVVLVAFVVGWLAAWLGVAIALRRLRRAAGEGWVERARMAYPARRVIGLDIILVPLAVGAIVGFVVAPGLGLAPVAWGVLAGLAGQYGVMIVGKRLERRLCWSPPDGATCRPGINLVALMLQPALLTFGLMVAVMPLRWGWEAAAVVAAGAALTTFHICGGWLIPLRWLGLARPASPRLAEAVARAADRTGILPRTTLELDSPQANALAWPVPRALIFVGPILDVLDDAELATVVVHELGHLDEPRSAYLVRLACSYLLVVLAALGPVVNSFGLWAGLVALGSVILAIGLARRVGRRMEERSDRMGRDHEGDDAGTYARALEAIHRANLLPAVLRGKRHVHPHLYDRMVASGVSPDYPRPGPPPRLGLAGLPILVLILAAYAAILIGMDSPRSDAYDLDVRAMARYKQGDLEGAAQLYRRAEELEPTSPYHAANVARVLIALGKFDEADDAIRRAEQAQGHSPDVDRAVSPLIVKVRAAIRRAREASRSAPDTSGDDPAPWTDGR